jgi:DNA-binding Xre family transcriptional regulator
MNTAQLAKHSTKHEKAAPIEVQALQQRVDMLLEQRVLTAKWLYEAVGMSKQGWSDMWASGSVKLAVVYRIARAFDMSIVALLGGEEQASSTSPLSEPAAPYGRAPFLEERVAMLEKHIEQLQNQLNRR